MQVDRREFLMLAGLAGAAGFVMPAAQAALRAADADLWAEAEVILRRIRAPTFPDRTFPITRFGASEADATAAFRRAIAACHAAGGGRVLVPAGRWVTGPLVLQSQVNVHLEEGATIAFSRDPAAYLPTVFTRWEGTELMGYSPFIYAFEQSDIAITGAGTLDGQADAEHWWPWTRQATDAKTRLREMAARGVRVADRRFGEGSFLRPNFIQPYRCTNVLIDGVTIVNSPMWEVHPVLCTNVIVRGLTIRSHGPNNDGCDPESCRDVLIERCTFDTGDDCIALKSGRNDDGRRLHAPIENVIIRDCNMRDGHGGVVIGSEISGGARNIFAERCTMDSPKLDRVLRFKTNAMRGGVIERVAMRDVKVGEVAEAIVAADFYYEEGDKGEFTPVLRDIDVRGVTSRRSKYAFLLKGYARSPVTNVRVSECTFDGVAQEDVLEGVQDLVLANVRINGQVRNERITREAAAHRLRIVLVGDSTVTDTSGWGLGFKQFVSDKAECLNMAANGRSSKSYLEEGRWKEALALKGDYYLIQFGHNDQPGKGLERETDPASTYPRFMARYVDDARAIGARPILITSLTRRTFATSVTGKVETTLGPWADAVKQLAAEKQVPVLDLHAHSLAWCESLGPDGCGRFNVTGPDGQIDRTHLDATGSLAFARLVIDDLRKAVPELVPYLREAPAPADTIHVEQSPAAKE
jgi:polygalacturonase/lysophospholipase L1-like esterase